MLRYLFEGYADAIVLATTLRVRPSRPAQTVRQFHPAPKFVDVPDGNALLNCTGEPTLKRRSPSRWLARWLALR